MVFLSAGCMCGVFAGYSFDLYTLLYVMEKFRFNEFLLELQAEGVQELLQQHVSIFCYYFSLPSFDHIFHPQSGFLSS